MIEKIKVVSSFRVTVNRLNGMAFINDLAFDLYPADAVPEHLRRVAGLTCGKDIMAALSKPHEPEIMEELGRQFADTLRRAREGE